MEFKGRDDFKGCNELSLSLETPKIDSSFTFVRSRRMIFFFLSFFLSFEDASTTIYDLKEEEKEEEGEEGKENERG